MPHPTFTTPDLTTFTSLDRLGLTATGQRLSTSRAEFLCEVTDPDSWCGRCGQQGVPRDTITRRLAHEPLGWRPTVLVIKHRRYRCVHCRHVWRGDLGKAAEARQKISRSGLRWALAGLVCQHLSVARIAEGLGVSWNPVNEAVLAEGRRLLIIDPARYDGVRVLGVDEHVWRHTTSGDKYVTVIVDLTAVREGTGPARCWTWWPGGPRRCSRAGWPNVMSSGSGALRWWRWTGSPASRLRLPRSCPRRWRCWIRSMWSSWVQTRWIVLGSGSSASSTDGAGSKMTRSTRPAGR
ncbi:hypothetical protein JOE62_000003 [Glutamicibacter nicotianae]|nr:hypothetical protein [Glutamicibacter nicotianae]